MYLTVKAEINIKPLTQSAEEISDIFYDSEFTDSPENEGDNILVKIDDDFDADDFEGFLEILLPTLEQVVDEKMEGEGKIYNADSDQYMLFEIESRGGSIRYRTSDWFIDEEIEDGESYDEYEESGYPRVISEDEFENYTHTNKKRKTINTNNGFGQWEYVD